MATGQVRRQLLGPDGTTIGTYNDDTILNSIVYEVEFPDGQSKEYTSNVIDNNMISQVDSDGFITTFVGSIIDH